MTGRRRPWWRTALDVTAVIALTMLALAAMELLPGGHSTSDMLVVDGDSLRPKDNSHDIRLQGIDAPELGQTCRTANGKSYKCGRRARNHLKTLIAGRDVTCRVMDVDRYQRSIAICHAGDTELNRQMVADGWAVAYRLPAYADAEDSAKRARKGIWQGAFESPGDWRSLHRSATDGSRPEPD